MKQCWTLDKPMACLVKNLCVCVCASVGNFHVHQTEDLSVQHEVVGHYHVHQTEDLSVQHEVVGHYHVHHFS